MFVQRCSVGGPVNYLWRNPGNFSPSKQSSSQANSPSIINSPVLSFPAVTMAPCRLKLSREETCCCPVGNTTTSPRSRTHSSEGGGQWTWRFDPSLGEEHTAGGCTSPAEDFSTSLFILFLVLCSTFSYFSPPKPDHESEAEDEAAEALWLSALGASTSAAGGARKWKLLSQQPRIPGVYLGF